MPGDVDGAAALGQRLRQQPRLGGGAGAIEAFEHDELAHRPGPSQGRGPSAIVRRSPRRGAVDAPAPAAVTGGHTFAQIVAGEASTCGVTTAGVMYCWGWNGYGQLGDGNTTELPMPNPTPVRGGFTFATGR
ncbi:MAG: hypothetical protein IPL61_11175 [Myxococcales bacterium]|nr:hypothetical protein [Myxococcales bacterium]